MRPERYELTSDEELKKMHCCGGRGRCTNPVVAGIWFNWEQAPRNYCEVHCGGWAADNIRRAFKTQLNEIEIYTARRWRD